MSNIEDINYENDYRVRAGREDSLKMNESNQTVEVSYITEDGDEITVDLPAKYDVCPTCNGKGKHVNPSIDAGGLSQDDFYEDPDFEEAYRSGRYDVFCYECKGVRVVPVIDEDACKLDPELQEHLDAYWDSCHKDVEYDAICRAERIMGA